MTVTTSKKPATKSDFVRSMPADAPAKEVVEKAKAAGVVLTESYVYEIRSADKRRSGKGDGKKKSAPKAATVKKGARTKKASSKRAARGGESSKRTFIESMPASTPVAEVVAAAKKAGVHVSANYVYKLRRGGGRQASPSSARKIARAVVSATPAKPSKRLEDAFLDAALDLGLSRASQLLDRVRARVKGLTL